MEEALKINGTIEELKKLALSCESWEDWEVEIDFYIAEKEHDEWLMKEGE
jgi:hypothetical protein